LKQLFSGTFAGVLTPALRYVVVGLCLATVIPLLLLNPHRLRREPSWSKLLNRCLIAVLLLANLVALGQLVLQLVTERSDGPGLILAAVAPPSS
jgi:hypothetical protein